MRFVPSEEDVMLRDAARRFLNKRPDSATARWKDFTEMGWTMAPLPEDVGGLGWGVHAAAIIAEELGRTAAPEPFIEVVVTAAQVLGMLAPHEVPAIATGEAMPILAHTEAASRGDPRWCETCAEAVDGGYRLTGAKPAVVGAPLADRLLVSAQVRERGITLFAVRPAPELLLCYDTIDGRTAADIRFDGYFVPADAVVGPVGGAADAIETAFDHTLVLLGADALGAMQSALAMTREYLMTRKQYGKLIGEFQALRHRLADMFIETEQARSMLIRGIEALSSADRHERSRIAAATKARIAQAGLYVTAQAIQLHGGIGVTEECLVGRRFARLIAYDARYGSADAHVQRFAELSAA